MSRIAKSSSFFLALFLMLGVTTGAVADPSEGRIYQIYPTSKKISVPTRSGYSYQHIEGDTPDWRLGKLKHVVRQGGAVLGNGDVQVFESTSSAGYHLVEESLVTGKLQLDLQGDVRTGFHYFIRSGETTFSDGEVRDHELGKISPIHLPPGEYNLQAVAIGYETPQPIPFTIRQADETVVIPLELVPNRILLFTRTNPPGVAQGSRATLRRIDPVKGKEIWNQEIEVEGNAIALSEGQYVLEFPQVEGFASHGSHGIATRFELNSYDHSQTIVGDYLKKAGELLVSMTTTQAVQEHLGTVSFSLIGPNGNRTRYPRPGDYVDASVPNKRSVLVPDLTPGTYTVEFDIDPRTFRLPSARKVTLKPENLAKLEQELVPNSGGVKASIVLPSVLEDGTQEPRITIRDEAGQFIKRSSGRQLVADDLPPGKYELVFEHVSGYEGPRPVEFTVRPGQLEGPFVGRYEEGSGSVVITYSTGANAERLDDVSISLRDQKHHRYTFPGEHHLRYRSKLIDSSTRQVTISDIPAGVYGLEFQIPNYDNLFVSVPSQMVVVNKGSTARVHQDIQARYGSVEAYAKLPEDAGNVQPVITLRDHFGEIKAKSESGRLLVHNLKPGNYQIVYGDHDELAAPTPIPVLVEALQAAGPYYGEYTAKTGTLVVNYTTGAHADRLDKVRFWLFNEKGYREMYPKDDQYIRNTESMMRTVVVEDLPQGSYSVQFLLPNADGLFASVPDRRVTITKGHVADIVQHITPRYGSIQASIEALPDDPSLVNYPKITVSDAFDTVIAESWDGTVAAEDLSPGEYWVSFDPIEGYETPAAQRVIVDPGRSVPPISAHYRVSTGTLVVIYDTDPKPEFLDDVQVKVVDLKDGQMVSLVGSRQDRFGRGRRLTLSQLPVGRYLVSFAVPTASSLFPEASDREIVVRPDDITQLNQQLRPTYGGLEASVSVASGDRPTHRVPKVFVQDIEGTIVAQTEAGHLLATELPPGKYQIIYEQLDGYLSPAPVEARVTANEIIGPFVGQYTLNSGRVIVKYQTGGNSEHLGKVRFWVSNDENFRRMYPFGDEFVDDEGTGVRTVVLDDLPLGNYNLEFFVPEAGSLFGDAPEQQFALRAGQTVELFQDFQPQYSSVTAYLDLPQTAISRHEIPQISIRDSLDRVTAQSATGILEVKDLIPGDYLLAYEPIENCISPDPVKIRVRPDTSIGPFIGKYVARTGTLVVEYGTGPKQERLDRVRFWLIDESNRRTMYPTGQGTFDQDASTGRNVVTIQDLPEGNYRLEFLVPNVDNLFSQIPRRELRITHGERTKIVQDITPNYGSLDVNLTFPQRRVGGLMPQIYLKDRVGKVVAVSETGRLSRQDLAPGRYEVVFEEVKGYDVPDSLIVDIESDKLAGPFFGTYNLAVGAMVVNYETGHRRDLLDKVRFWVVNENNSGAMYPQGENYIEDLDRLKRKVIIPDLPSGQYHVDFLLPDLNGLFADTSRLSYQVDQGEVTTIDQSFSPRFASVTAKIEAPQALSEAPMPAITLLDSHGHPVLSSNDGGLVAPELIPGTYTLEFEALKDFDAPDPIVLTLGPHDRVGPFEESYKRHQGRLVVSYQTGELRDQLHDIKFALVDEYGHRKVFPAIDGNAQVDSTGAIEVVINDLPVGNYQIDWELPEGNSLFEEVRSQGITVSKGATEYLHQEITPRYGALEVVAQLPGDIRWRGSFPSIVLRDPETKAVKATAHNGELNAEVLTPGDYEVVFEDSSWLEVPDNFLVSVAPGRKTGPIIAEYSQGLGSVNVSYHTGPRQERLNDVRFWLVDEEGNSQSYPLEGSLAVDSSTNGYRVPIENLPVGDYTVEWYIPNLDGLFGSVESQELKISKNQNIELLKPILPYYGALEVAVDMPKGAQEVPVIEVRDRFGMIRASSTSGELLVDNLVPDTYTVSFASLNNYSQPMDVVVEVEPFVHHGPYIGEYEVGRGTVALSYGTGERADRIDDVQLWLTNSLGEREELNLKAVAQASVDGVHREVILPDLPFGKYAIEAFVPNEDKLFVYENQLSFYLNKDENLAIDYEMVPQYGAILAEAVLPPSCTGKGCGSMALFDKDGSIVGESQDGVLEASSLIPGDYTLAFGDEDYLEAPDAMTISVFAGEAVGPIMGEYSEAAGSLIVSCDVGAATDYLDLVRVQLKDDHGKTYTFPASEEKLEFVENNVAQLAIDSLPVGDYTAEFFVVNSNGLFPEMKQTVSVRKNEAVRVQQSLEAKYSQLQAHVDLSAVLKQPKSAPKIQLREKSGRLVAESSTGSLELGALVPGDYLLSFEDLAAYICPDCQELHVEADTSYGPITGRYAQRFGAVDITSVYPDGYESDATPVITLVDEDGATVAQSDQGEFVSRYVVPGEYTVRFSEHPDLFTPDELWVVVKPDEESHPLKGYYKPGTGTAVITYDVGEAKEYLSQVTTVIRDASGKPVTLPREGDRFRELDDRSALIVAKGLPVGDYTLEFFVESDSRLFADLKSDPFRVSKAVEAEITCYLNPEYSSVHVEADFSEAVTLPESQPGVVLRNPEGCVIAQSDTGVVEANRLVPGEYTVEFRGIAGYHAPDDLLVSLERGSNFPDLKGVYQQRLGTINVTYDGGKESDKLKGVGLTIWDSEGNAFSHIPDAKAVQSASGQYQVLLDRIPEGDYKIEFLVPTHSGLFTAVDPVAVTVRDEIEAQVAQTFRPHYGAVFARTEVQTKVNNLEVVPGITLKNVEGEIVGVGEAGALSVDGLYPGVYTLEYEQIDGFHSPSTQVITVGSEEVVGPVLGSYADRLGDVQVVYSTTVNGDYLDDITFSISQADGSLVGVYPQGKDFETVEDTGERLVTIPELPAGDYNISFMLPDTHELLPDALDPIAFTVEDSQVAHVKQPITPRYGGLEVAVNMPADAEARYGLPLVSVHDSEGNLVLETRDGYLLDLELAPGSYEVTFEDLAACFTPEKMTLDVRPHEITGPLLGQYETATGSVHVRYNTGRKDERLDQVTFTVVDEAGHRNKYPMAEDLVASNDLPGREVVLPELPVGKYQIYFNVPNRDGLFGQMPSLEVDVAKNETVIIDESLQPRYGGIVISTEIAEPLKEQAMVASLALAGTGTDGLAELAETWAPTIKVLDSQGRLVTSSEGGELAVQDLAPGDYHILYEDIPNCAQTEPVYVHIGPEEVKGPYLWEYKKASGSVLVTYDTGTTRTRLSDVSFTLTDEEGNQQRFPKPAGYFPDATGYGREVAIHNIPVGHYKLSFDVPNEDSLFADRDDHEIVVTRDMTSSVTEKLEPRFAAIHAAIEVELPHRLQGQAPSMSLLDANGEVLEVSHDGYLDKEELLPGKYSLAFNDLPNYYTPKKIELDLKPGVELEPITATYEIGKGEAIVAYSTGEHNERIDRVHFWLIDEEGNREMYPKEGDFRDDEETGYREVRVMGLPFGTYVLEFILPNQDNLFVDPERKTLVVNKDDVAEWSEYIEPHYGSLDVMRVVDGDTDEDLPSPEIWLSDSFGQVVTKLNSDREVVGDLLPGAYSVIFQQAAPGWKTPEPVAIEVRANEAIGPVTGVYETLDVPLSVHANDEDRAWRLLCNGDEIFSGKGSENRIMLQPGKGYHFDIPPEHGYEATMSPAGAFKLSPGQAASAELYFERKYGALHFEAALREGEVATVVVTPSQGGDPIRQSISATEGVAAWTFKSLPTGNYDVAIELPEFYEAPIQQTVQISKDETLSIQPQVKPIRQVNIHSNANGSKFHLESEDGKQHWTKLGREVAFTGLLPGKYRLSFGDDGKGRLLPPPPRTLEVLSFEDLDVDVNFRRGASLVVSSNVEEYTLAIESLDEPGEGLVTAVADTSEFFTLPEGRYLISFEPLEGQQAIRYGESTPDPVEVKLAALRPERVHAVYEAKAGSLVVTTNLPTASFTVRDVTDSEGLILGHYTGDYSVIPMTFNGEYEVTFDDIPNYETPLPITIKIDSDKRRVAGGNYVPQQLMVHIETGATILGDVFGEGADDEGPALTVELDGYSIGMYAVSVSQYGAWLTKVIREGKVDYISSGKRKGIVVDEEGRILCDTTESDPDAQLKPKSTEEGWIFTAVPGREQHPMTEVSWYGAQTYCVDQGYRLPTEAEWEKAASVAISSIDGSIKKYRYGCGCDDLDSRLCNYMDSYDKTKQQQTGTTEVGFYNGINLLDSLYADLGESVPLLEKAGTRAAQSPYGLYDMSGNVREWTADWYSAEGHKNVPERNPQGPGHGTKKVTKGGSFDSFAYEVRASARLPQLPERTDRYTGFRVVMEDNVR